MATHQVGGQARSIVRGKLTYGGVGVARALISSSIKNIINADTGSTDYGSAAWSDFCKATVQQEGNNLLGKTFHYQESWNTEGPQKCYSATIISLLGASCGGADGVGIVANIVFTDTHGAKQNQSAVVYQGYGAKFLYPNFHVASHDSNLYPPTNARLLYIPPQYIPPVDPLAPPSPDYSGCTSISATGLNNGNPTWVCYCDGQLVYQAVVQVTDNIDDITAQYGVCAGQNIEQDPHTAYHAPQIFKGAARHTGEYSLNINIPTYPTVYHRGYQQIKGTMGNVTSIDGLSTLVKPWVFNDTAFFSTTASYVLSYFRMGFNIYTLYDPDTGIDYPGRDRSRWAGLYQTYNHQNYFIVFDQYSSVPNEPNSRRVLYSKKISAGNAFGGAAIYNNVEIYNYSNKTTSAPNHNAIVLNNIVINGIDSQIFDTTWLRGGAYVEVGVEARRLYPEVWHIPAVDFSNLALGRTSDRLDFFHPNPALDTICPVPWDWPFSFSCFGSALEGIAIPDESWPKTSTMCVFNYANNWRRIQENWNMCGKCGCIPNLGGV